MDKICTSCGRGFEKVISWILWSSVNEEKISLTLKAGIPFLVLLKFSDAVTLNVLADGIVSVIVQAATLITGGIALAGAFRKLVITIQDIIASHKEKG